MRIWDIEPSRLCREHLLGEHRELHAIWGILTRHKKGYSKHPETLRWKGKLRALYKRHKELVQEMCKRGYCHKSTLNKNLAKGASKQTKFLQSRQRQVSILKAKKCSCSL